MKTIKISTINSRLAKPEGEYLIVQSWAKGQNFFKEVGFSETEVRVQSGRMVNLVCLNSDFRRTFRVPDELLTQVTSVNGTIHFAAQGVCISINDLPEGQYVEVLPLETEEGPAVFLPVPNRQPPTLWAAVAELIAA